MPFIFFIGPFYGSIDNTTGRILKRKRPSPITLPNRKGKPAKSGIHAAVKAAVGTTVERAA